MNAKDVMTRFGGPYKTGLYQDSSQVSHEDWYYRENLFIKKWYEVTTILRFRDGKVVSMEPGKETPLYEGFYRGTFAK